MTDTVIPARAGTDLSHRPLNTSGENGARTREDDRRWLTFVLLVIAALALLVPALLVRFGPTVVPSAQRHRTVALPPRRVVPPAEVPEVEPVALVDLTPDDARAFNAGVPFVAGPIPPARPFRFVGGVEDRARATDCLAVAVLYEAGDDTSGQRAVAQVVLNRVRHPAYPKTVCGVVFQGAERSTGCQFSFSCDGALARWTPAPAAWKRAQEVAMAALSGSIDKRVGWATHYHTDWVVPYWQSSLDKIAAVGTHLFFRWTGWWGTAGAFHTPAVVAEPVEAQLATLSEAHRTDVLPADAVATDGALPVPPGKGPAPVSTDPDSFLVNLPPGTTPDAMPALARAACADRPQCRYSAWGDGARTPRTLPLAPEQIASMAFAYLRDRAAGVDKPLWNCQQTPRAKKAECMKVQVLVVSTLPALPIQGATRLAPVVPHGPVELTGVRRRATPAPQPLPTPIP